MSSISRQSYTTRSYVVTSSATTSPSIPYAGAAGGVFVVDAVTGGAATLSWYAVFDSGTVAQLNDGSSDVTTSITVGKAYPLPDALFGCQFVEAVTNAGTATIRLTVKS